MSDQIGFRVAARPCANCLLGSSPVVSKARIKEIIRECVKKDIPFICHVPQVKALDGSWQGSTEVACRAFHEAFPSQMGRIAERLRRVIVVDVEASE